MKPYTYTASDGSEWTVACDYLGCAITCDPPLDFRWWVRADPEAAIEALIAEREGEK